MTITLLDLYNTAAAQEWSMYDSDAESDAEFEKSLVIAINKAIKEIYYSFNFPFRERIHIVLTIPQVADYDMPYGLIKKDENGSYSVMYNSKRLEFVENSAGLMPVAGTPEKFFFNEGSKIILYPVPVEKGILTIAYNTLAIGETTSGEEIAELKNGTDALLIPSHLEALAKEAIVTRTMLNTIASETDENYSAYKKQADNVYNLLVKYSKGVEPEKHIGW